MTESTLAENNDDNFYKSTIIRGRVAGRLGGQTLEDFVGQNYVKEVKECLDVLDIKYPVTAVGILGRALEKCTKEYFIKKIKQKTAFQINSGNSNIAQIRKAFCSKASKQADRLKLLNQQKVKINGKEYQLKRRLLKNEYFNNLDSIRDARNDAFHGCEDEEYFKELEAKSYILIEWGIIALITLLKEIRED